MVASVVVLEKPIRLEFDNEAASFLRSLKVEDITEAYIDGLNDPEVNKFLMGPRSQHQTRELVAEFVLANDRAIDGVLLGLFVGDVLSGTIRLHDATEEHVYLGLAIFNKQIWGQGWGRKMISRATTFVTKELGIGSVLAGIDLENLGSQKAFLAAGFECIKTSDPQLWRFQL